MTDKTIEAIKDLNEKGLSKRDCSDWVAGFESLEQGGDGRWEMCFKVTQHILFEKLSEDAKKEIYNILFRSLTRKRNPLRAKIPTEVVKLIELRFGE